MILSRLASAALLLAAAGSGSVHAADIPAALEKWNADEEWNADEADSPKWNEEVSDEEWNAIEGIASAEDAAKAKAEDLFPTNLISARQLQGTASPTGAPTLDPLVVTIVEGTTNNGNAESSTEVTATVTIANVDCDADLSDGSALEEELEKTLKPLLCIPGASASNSGLPTTQCTVEIVEMRLSGCPARRARHTRALQTSYGTLYVELVVATKTYCANPAPTDCADLQATAAAVYNAVSDNLQAVFVTGNLAALLAASQTPAALAALSNAALATNPLNIGPLVNALLAVLGDWYPDWHGGTETCKNDGNAPLYMRRTRSFIKNSLESCCLAYYSWDMTNCMIDGGADASAYVTNDFYVDYASDSCKQSCLEASATATLNCGGLIPSWKTPYKTAEECCKIKLFWVNEESCVSKSTGGSGTATTPTGSGDWYVNWQSFKCVTDCPKANGGDCGGLANSWDIKYSSASTCCSTHLSWLDTSKQSCT